MPCWPQGLRPRLRTGIRSRLRRKRSPPGFPLVPSRSAGLLPGRAAIRCCIWWIRHQPACRNRGSRRIAGAGRRSLLDWLDEQPGQTWQEQWLASGADAAGDRWADDPARWLRCRGIYSTSRLELMTSSLLVLVGADVIRPSLGWLLTGGGKKRKLAAEHDLLA